MSTSSITRVLSDSNISRQKTSNTMVKKNNSIVAPDKSALTPDTIERLNTDDDNYNKAIAAVTTAKASRNAAKNVADTKRELLDDNIGGFFNTINNNIKLHSMTVDARAFYGLSTGNKKSPIVNTDIKRELWGKRIIDGDAQRVAAGGSAMANPTILQFKAIFDGYNTVITGLSTLKTNVQKEIAAVNVLNKEMDSMLLHATNEIETTYSELASPAMRAAAREYGVRYVSVGLPIVVSGTIISKATGLPLPKVKVHIGGGRKFALSGIDGKYSLNTTLYGDLELYADLTDFTENMTSITLADGVNMTVDIAMEAE